MSSQVLLCLEFEMMRLWVLYQYMDNYMAVFSAANLALAGFPLTNALGENLPSRH